MADLRYDPVFGIWVAIATKRRERPMEFVPTEQIHKQIVCPFCSGNENETPTPVVTYAADGQPLTADDDPSSWAVRIMPNKYPSLRQDKGITTCGPYQCESKDGIQELVIPTPRHVASVSELTIEELSLSLQCCQIRVSELQQLSSIEHVMLFFNCRSAAGASLEHIHFQIMGSPVLSSFLAGRTARNKENIAKTGRSLMTSLLDWETEQEKRIVKETKNFVMFCPFASRFAFQVWVVPKSQDHSYSQMPTEFHHELAELFHAYVTKLEELLESPGYNLLLHLAPNGATEKDHWFFEICPRLNRMAGFELGTDVWVNPVPPDLAAKRLQF